MEAVRSGAADAFITDAATLRYAAGRIPCDLDVVGDNFGPGTLVYGLQKNSPFTKPLNSAMLKVSIPQLPHC
jgi:ABC-type amino acid transport substrate-binding protein